MTTDKNTSDNHVHGSAGELFVDDGGSGGIPVLFLHSFGGSTEHWREQLKHLRASRRAIAFDLRGHGSSSAPANGQYNVDEIASDIDSIIQRLGLHEVILVGHSMGGSAAIAYAGRHPEKVAGLLVVGTPGKTDAKESAAVIASLESDKYAEVMKKYMQGMLSNAKPSTDSLERKGMAMIGKEASIKIIRSIFAYDPLPDLTKYPGPVMIVDRAGSKQSNSLHSFFPAVKYAEVPGTSHWIQLDAPAEFNSLLDQFLSIVSNER